MAQSFGPPIMSIKTNVKIDRYINYYGYELNPFCKAQ